MEDNKRKQIMIGIIIVCIVSAVAITIYTNTGGGVGSGTGGKRLILCTECNESFELSRTEVMDKLTNRNPAAPPGVMSLTGDFAIITCPACNEDAAQFALKCKKCGAVFLMKPPSDGEEKD